MDKIFLKPFKRYRSLWIYRTEIQSNIDKIETGSIVKVYEAAVNKFIGMGYINPKSIIAVRLLSFREENIDENFLKRRILKSLKYREEFLGLKDTYRLIFSE